MSAIFARAKSKTAHKGATETTARNGDTTTSAHSNSGSRQARAFFDSAPPAQILRLPVQRKVAIGRPNDAYEREADAVADRVETGRPVASISTLPSGGLSTTAQRQASSEDEAVQSTALQRQSAEEGNEETAESAQTLAIQREEEEGSEETAQTAIVQRQQEASEDTAQTMTIQRQEEDTRETAQALPVQRQEDAGDEEAAQATFMQRSEEKEEEEPAQTATVQRQQEAPEDTAQTMTIQRQEEDSGETAQTLPVQRQEGAGDDEAAQATFMQRSEKKEAEETVQERSAGPPATADMRTAARSAIHNRGPGEPMNPLIRQRIESSQGVDLSEVRVHEGSSARQAAGALKAKAFTHKNHIWLGQGQSQTDTHLMAHETTHVLQQGGVVRRKPLEETEPKHNEEEKVTEALSTPEKREVTPSGSAATPTEAPSAKEHLEPEPPLPAGTESVTGPGPVLQRPSESIQAGLSTRDNEADVAEEKKTAPSAAPAAEKEENKVPAPESPVSETTTGSEEAPSPAGEKQSEKTGTASQVKKTTDKKQDVPAAEKAKVEEKEGEKAPAVPAPGDDPKFKAVVGRLERQARQEKSHEPASRKVAAARAAAVAPENDRSSRAQADQVEVMDKQEAKKPDKDDFLTMLRKALLAIAPENMEETEKFKKEGKAGQLKATLNKKVDQQKEDSSKDIKSATAAEPDPNTVKAKEVTPIPAAPANPPGRNLRSKEILPDAKPEADITVEHNKQKAEQLMAENDIDEEQLERANEPQFSDALKAKKDLEKHADKVPQTYREEEQRYLEKAKGDVETEEKAARYSMRAKRNKNKSDISTRQQETKKKEEAERKKVADKIESMYKTTRKNVEDKLKTLDVDINKTFDDGEKRARDNFESYVDRRMRAYKYDRYISQTGGLVLWGWDKLTGMPDEVNKFYVEGRDRYIKDMDVVLVKIANTVETRLKEAKEEIAKGKKEIKAYVDDLPKNLKKAGEEAEKNVSSRFDDLEESVDSKKQELAQSMARRYQESRKKLDERIEALKKENQGLVDAFIGKIKEIIEILRNFKNRIMSLMKQGGDAVRKIVKDPGKFLDNLGAALKKGFNQFTDNFMKHLKAAFINWLFGTMSKAGIEIPSEFSFKGVFGLILQVLGITPDWIRSRVVRLIGAKNVERIEKAWSIVSTLISGGIGGLWEKAKEYLGDLKDKLFDTIQNWLVTEIVKQAVLWVLSLLNPVSALLKIIKMIYDVVMFFVENIDRILQLVEAVIQSISKIVAGNIGAAANWIENAMARILPIIISFLARLLGIGGIANKIKSFIKKIQKKVRGVVDKILKKIVKGIKKFIGKGKTFGKKVAKRGKTAVGRAIGWLKSLAPQKFKMSGRSHLLKVSVLGGKPKLVMSSSRAENFITKIDKAKKATSDGKIIATLNDFRSEALKIQGVLESAQSITDKKKQKKEKARYSKKIKEFTIKIGKYGADNKLEDLIPAGEFEDEGKVGKYSSFGSQKELVADHEPQNSLMKKVKSSVRFTRPANTSRIKVFGKNTNIAKYSDGSGITMNMHVSRHSETRTFKSGGPDALDKSRIKMGADNDWVISTNGSSLEDARKEAQNKVKIAVSDALVKDRQTVESIYKDKKWKLSKKVSDRAVKATSTIESQNKSSWPEVFK